MINRHISRWIFFLIISGVILFSLMSWGDHSDRYLKKAQAFVVSQSAITDSVGNVREVTVQKRRIFQKTIEGKLRREYVFLVAGEKGRAQVVVTAESAKPDGSDTSFLISSINPSRNQ